MKILNRVTVTGADDSINPEELWKIAAEYPFVEFGILFSRKATLGTGSVRFPSKTWLKHLMRAASRNLNPRIALSCHLCGEWVEGFLSGHDLDLDTVVWGLSQLFYRRQINTHAQSYQVNELEFWPMLPLLRYDIIFQLDGNVGTRLAHFACKNRFKASGLFDLSHGAGVLPESWPAPLPRMYCGYAGGLSPENVAGQMDKIIKATNGMATWIDCETTLFRPDPGKFNLDRVREFLKAAAPFVL